MFEQNAALITSDAQFAEEGATALAVADIVTGEGESVAIDWNVFSVAF